MNTLESTRYVDGDTLFCEYDHSDEWNKFSVDDIAQTVIDSLEGGLS